MRIQSIRAVLAAAAAVVALAAGWPPTQADAGSDRHCDELVEPTGASPLLPRLRLACPFLAGVVEDFAMQDLGEAFPEEQTGHSRPIVVVATNDLAWLAKLARRARRSGATLGDFREALYLTTVTEGVPQAIAATRALLNIFEKWEQEDNPCRTSS